MIPKGQIQQWAATAPWPDLRQVEQDLILSRVLCDLFNNPKLSNRIAFRGGTAIHKLLFDKPLRYSEDIDLVQTLSEPIGKIVDEVRDSLAWLGNCNRTQAQHSMHLTFRFQPEFGDGVPMKIKVEINTREHVNLLGLTGYPFGIESDWHQDKTEIVSFEKEELFGTKLRAMLQRDKQRDLFDLYEGIKNLELDFEKIVACFLHYLQLEEQIIRRAHAEERMLRKLNRSLNEDVVPLLPAGVVFSEQNALDAFHEIWNRLVTRIPGEPWKLTPKVVKAIRSSAIPTLLEGVEF